MGWIRVLVLFLLLFGAVKFVRAHEITALGVVANFESTGVYSLELGVDVKLVRDPFGEGEPPPENSDPGAPLTEEEIAEVEKQVAEYLTTSLRFYFDETPFAPSFRLERAEIEAPDAMTAPPGGLDGAGSAPRTRYAASAEGSIPEGTKEFLLEATPEAKSPVVLVIRRNGKPTRRSQVLYSGEFSRPVDIASLEEMPEAGTEAPPGGEVKSAKEAPGSPGPVATGFFAVLPLGLDHILFVLGMFLLSRNRRPLLWQVAAFTVAHSIALALGANDVAALSPRMTGILIAASLVYVGLENVFVKEMKWWRLVAVFGFGLVHGFGFAGDFGSRELPLSALTGFNVGIELGQLGVLVVAFVAVYPFRSFPKYRGAVVVPASLAIAAAGLYWIFERSLFSG